MCDEIEFSTEIPLSLALFAYCCFLKKHGIEMGHRSPKPAAIDVVYIRQLQHDVQPFEGGDIGGWSSSSSKSTAIMKY